MQTLKGILIKTCSKTMQRIYTKGSLQGLFFVNSMHVPSTTPLIALTCFHLLNCKRLLQVVWIPPWYFVTYAVRSINIGTIKMFKQGFKIFKPEVLKAANFRRWNETVFQKLCDTYCLSKILLKNMSVLTHFEICVFKFCCRCYRSMIVYFLPHF